MKRLPWFVVPVLTLAANSAFGQPRRPPRNPPTTQTPATNPAPTPQPPPSPSDGTTTPNAQTSPVQQQQVEVPPPQNQTQTPQPVATPPAQPAEHPLLRGTGTEYGVGLRFGGIYVIPQIAGIFATVEPGWGGGGGVMVGPEFSYRNNNFEVLVGLMYVGYNSAPGFFRGKNEGPTNTERVEAQLFGLYATVHMLWGIRLHRMFEIQLGFAAGLGYIGGNLYRSQAYPSTGGGYTDCLRPGGPNGTQGAYCDNSNSRYTNPGGTAYTEPSFFSNGSLPSILPWLSVPHIAFHFRPHRNFDVKLDVGYALIGVYGGLSTHVIF